MSLLDDIKQGFENVKEEIEEFAEHELTALHGLYDEAIKDWDDGDGIDVIVTKVLNLAEQDPLLKFVLTISTATLRAVASLKLKL